MIQFIKQVFNWGVARINLGKIDTAMLEPVHFLPSLSILLSLFIILIIYQLDWGISEIFLLFFSLQKEAIQPKKASLLMGFLIHG